MEDCFSKDSARVESEEAEKRIEGKWRLSEYVPSKILVTTFTYAHSLSLLFMFSNCFVLISFLLSCG